MSFSEPMTDDERRIVLAELVWQVRLARMQAGDYGGRLDDKDMKHRAEKKAEAFEKAIGLLNSHE